MPQTSFVPLFGNFSKELTQAKRPPELFFIANGISILHANKGVLMDFTKG
jgi:hypothetical protein